MLNFPLTDDLFGDRFTLAELNLPRPAEGYAVQMLDTDRLLDTRSGEFLTMREPQLSGLFDSFDTAYRAAVDWLQRSGTPLEQHALAIVPASFDKELRRHILIYGALRGQP